MVKQVLLLKAHQRDSEERGQEERPERFQRFKTVQPYFFLFARHDDKELDPLQECCINNGKVHELLILLCLPSPLRNICHPHSMVDLLLVIHK